MKRFAQIKILVVYSWIEITYLTTPDKLFFSFLYFNI